MRKLVPLVVLFLTVPLMAQAETPAPTFHYFKASDGVKIALRVAYPPDYVAGNTYPTLFTMEGG